MKKSTTETAKHILQLRDLAVGDKFTINGLENEYRNLEVVTITELSITVKGEHCCDSFKIDGDGEKQPDWKSLGNNWLMSCKTEVKRVK